MSDPVRVFISYNHSDRAFAASRLHAAAWRRCFDPFDVSGALDIALSSRRRRERDCLSVIGAWVRPLGRVVCR